jgi:hypothetical protein
MNDISETTTEKIIRITGREPVSCRCASCQNQCKRAPCLGTPQDIWALIEAGYKDKLAVTAWGVGMILGKLPFPVPMVQVTQTPDGCVFFQNGLCELHNRGLKPTEGRLSYHTLTEESFDFSKSLAWNVAREWLNEKNVPLILRIFERFNIIGK